MNMIVMMAWWYGFASLVKIGCTYEVIHRHHPQAVRNAQQHAQCCNVFDSLGTLPARGRAAVADSSQAMLGAIGRAMCCYYNTGKCHTRCNKETIN
jgi:hypothetical protein